MAEKQLKSIKFPGLDNIYTIPEIDNTLSVEGMMADSKAVGEALEQKQPKGDYALKSEIPAPVLSVDETTGILSLIFSN